MSQFCSCSLVAIPALKQPPQFRFAINGCLRLVPMAQGMIFWSTLLFLLTSLNSSKCALAIRHCTTCSHLRLLVARSRSFPMCLRSLLVRFIFLLGKVARYHGTASGCPFFTRCAVFTITVTDCQRCIHGISLAFPVLGARSAVSEGLCTYCHVTLSPFWWRQLRHLSHQILLKLWIFLSQCRTRHLVRVCMFYRPVGHLAAQLLWHEC
ncbi:hypothetical protein EDB84DRAFT_315685 [Lactarius hengduanensis]|nr:hypothetical protein EDB84DRAFT_315685 [Lactarius hengduanensis]